MNPEFELVFTNTRKLNSFIKVCESLCCHSDTALMKVKKKGIYILLTDFESYCSVETRVTTLSGMRLTLHVQQFTAKILLDYFVDELKKLCRLKRQVVIVGEPNHVVKVKEYQPGHQHGGNDAVRIKSTEHRPRVFHILSTRQFVAKSQDCVQFRIMNSEFNKIITTQAILSGINGGVGALRVYPKPDEKTCDIQFALRNDGGNFGVTTISTSTISEDVPILRMPSKNIEIVYFVTYLKRSQSILSFPTDYVTVYVSERGIFFHTDIKDGLCTVFFTCNIDQVDLDSYV